MPSCRVKKSVNSQVGHTPSPTSHCCHECMVFTEWLVFPLADYLPLGSWVVVRVYTLTPALESHWLWRSFRSRCCISAGVLVSLQTWRAWFRIPHITPVRTLRWWWEWKGMYQSVCLGLWYIHWGGQVVTILGYKNIWCWATVRGPTHPSLAIQKWFNQSERNGVELS